ncbi:MAG: hypothetical protein HY819_04125 [Acidobacteria bacterium]|nr:hypothetical protein [Acidobacteriota bacterium]
MLATNSLKEHRRELREETNSLVKFKAITNYKAEEHFAVILDINNFGVSLFTYTLLPIGTKILIDRGDSLLLRGEIVTVGFDKDSDMIRFGVRFLKEGQLPAHKRGRLVMKATSPG